MGQKVTFDTYNKIIQIDVAPVLINGEWVIELDVKIDIYSDGKEDWVTSELLRRRTFPIKAVGGNPLPGSKELGSSFFLASDWKIQPYPTNHIFRVNGNLYSEDGTSPFTPASGSFNVFLEQQVSSLVDSTVQQLSEIEHMAFGGMVTIDVIDGTEGTDYPTGTMQYPTKSIEDAVIIANSKGFRKFFIKSSMIGENALNAGTDIIGFEITGESSVNTQIEIEESALCENLTIRNCDIFGSLDGGTHIINCKVGELVFFNGHIDHCGLYGNIYLAGYEDAVISDCYIVDQDNTPVINMGGSGQNLSMPNYSGIVNIKNLNSADEEIGIGLNAGLVILEDTITAGAIIVGGIGLLYDYSTGTTNVNSSGLVNRIAEEYDRKIIIDVNSGYAGNTYPIGTLNQPVNNVNDALILADKYSCESLHLHSDITFTTGMNLNRKIIIAHKSRSINVTLAAGLSLLDTEFHYVGVTGISSHGAYYSNCMINNLTEMCGIFNECYFDGENACEDSTHTHVIIQDSRAYDRVGTQISCGSARVTIEGWVSHLILTDKNDDINQVRINSTMARITVENSCTAGIINLSGIAYATDNSSAGCTVLTDRLTNRDMQAETSTRYLERKIYIDTEAIENGNGSQDSPYNILSDAVDYAESQNIKTLVVYSDIVLDRLLKNFKIEGVGVPTVDTNGQDLNKSEFWHCKMEGTYLGNIIVQQCGLLDNFHLSGFFQNCGVGGDLICIDGSTVLIKDCASNFAGLDRPTISMNVDGWSHLSIRSYNGGITIKNCNNALDAVTVEVDPGSVTFDSSCTAGEMVARGVGKFVDETTGATVINEMLNSNSVSVAVWDEQTSKHILSGSFGEAVSQTSGLTTNQSTMLLEIYELYGLDPTKPLIVTNTSRDVGVDISQTIVSDANQTTVTRV